MNYDFKATEQKWQQKWEEAKVFEAQDNSEKPKFYGLVEFPYPSGAGMHVGHIKAYSGLEVLQRDGVNLEYLWKYRRNYQNGIAGN